MIVMLSGVVEGVKSYLEKKPLDNPKPASYTNNNVILIPRNEIIELLKALDGAKRKLQEKLK